MKGTHVIQKSGRTFVAILIVAAVAAPVAQADPWQLERASQMSDSSDRHGTTGTQISDALDRYLASSRQPIPDAVDRYVANNPQPTPDAVDRYLANESRSTSGPVDRFAISDHSDRSDVVRFASSAPATGGPGLDWDVFAVGFGLGIAACVLGGAAIWSVRRTLVHA